MLGPAQAVIHVGYPPPNAKPGWEQPCPRVCFAQGCLEAHLSPLVLPHRYQRGRGCCSGCDASCTGTCPGASCVAFPARDRWQPRAFIPGRNAN